MAIAPTFQTPLARQYRAAGHWRQEPLGALLSRTVRQHAGREGIIDHAQRLTFRELDRLSQRAAVGFRSLGLGPGDVIAYQLPNWWEAVVVFLGAVRMGATVNPLLPMFRESELGFTLRQSGAQALVIPGVWRGCDYRDLLAALRPKLPALRAVFVARDAPRPGMHSWESFLATAPERALDDASAGPPVAAASVALLMYTSGTTAEPKGVLHTHNTLAAEVMSLARVHQLTPQDRTLMPSPLTHISGVIHGMLVPALLGTSAVLMERWEPRQALDLIARERVTYMVGAPTFLQDLVTQAEDCDGGDLRTLRLFSCGGAGVSPALVRRARERFPTCVTKRVYGSTEFPTLTTTDAANASRHGIDTEGRAIWPAEVRIADDAGESLPPGVAGEVQGRGPEGCVGYRDGALNADAFTADGWFRTGDLGILDAAGYLRITGRLKDIIIRKGEKISVKEVEDQIAAHPAVAEVAVIPRPDPAAGERACAVVRLRPGMRLDLVALTQFLAAKGLAKHKWPEHLQVVADFPRTESGKIRRAKLQERYAERCGR
ncbi:MAG: AMP-binding protein [Candidatus Binatia bacterium]